MEPGVTSNFESTFFGKGKSTDFCRGFLRSYTRRSAHTGTTVALIPVPRRSCIGPQKPSLKEQNQQEEKEQQDRIVESGYKHNDANCKNGGYDDHERSWFAVVTGWCLIVLFGVVLHIGVDLMQRYAVMGVILLNSSQKQRIRKRPLCVRHYYLLLREYK